MVGKGRSLSHVAFVRHHSDLTSNVSLREDDTVLYKLALRAEVHSSIQQLARPSPRDELVAKISDLRVHGNTL